jgi:hypothetical protein
VPDAQYFPPNGSIITLDPNMVVTQEAYLLTGYISQEFSVRATNMPGGIVRLENIGNLPATWCELDNPYRPESIIQIPLLPGNFINVGDTSGNEDRKYLAVTVFSGHEKSRQGKIYPSTIRINFHPDGEKIFVQYI